MDGKQNTEKDQGEEGGKIDIGRCKIGTAETEMKGGVQCEEQRSETGC